MWDNSARRSVNAYTYIGSIPTIYEQWLSKTVERTRQRHVGDEQIVFINAWNEWAEGCHLEPDQKWGRAYLEATHSALTVAPKKDGYAPSVKTTTKTNQLKQVYWRTSQYVSDIRTILTAMLWHLKHRLPLQ